MAWGAAFVIYVWTIVLLSFKMFGVAAYTGWKRRAAHVPANPEDASLLLKNHDSPTDQADSVDRGLNLHRNDMENVYIFFFLSTIFPIAAASGDYAPVAWIVFNIIFLVSRFAYTFCYIWALQPWRSVCYWVGLSVSIIYGIWAMIASIITVSDAR